MNITNPVSVFSESSPTFSPGRCLAYGKLYINSNRKTLLLSLCQIFVITLILFLFNFYVSGKDIYSYNGLPQANDMLWRSETSIMEFLFIIITMLSGSMMFSAVSSRRSRLSTLQVPASQLEKFLTWFVIYLPLTVIACWICFYAADICRVLWVKAFTPFSAYAHVIPLKDVMLLYTETVDTPETTFSIVTTFSFCLFLNSLFALGGLLFHRLAFIKTMICVFILFMICLMEVFLGINFFYGGHLNGGFNLQAGEYSSSVILLSIFTALSALIYWLCYARLKEEEIISRW